MNIQTISRTQRLKFAAGNKKLSSTIATFTLPAGKTCPFAESCRTVVGINKDNHPKLYDLQTGTSQMQFRCYAASLEVAFSNLRAMVNYNMNLLKSCSSMAEMIDLIDTSLPIEYNIFRLHVGGDFFSEDYFKAWMYVAALNPSKLFYAYTKSLPYWVENMSLVPVNMVLTASYGGRHDELIVKHNLKNVKIYTSEYQAYAEGREIDFDDSLARDPSVKQFGLLLHGGQPRHTSKT